MENPHIVNVYRYLFQVNPNKTKTMLRNSMYRRNKLTNYFWICILIMLLVLVYVDTHPHTNEHCKAKILKRYPDAICYSVHERKSCDVSCKQQGNYECKKGRKKVRKLQCRKSIKQKNPIACCCLIECNVKKKNRNVHMSKYM